MLSSVVAVVLVFLLLFLLFYQSFVLGLPCLCGGLMLVVQKFLPVIMLQSPYDAPGGPENRSIPFRFPLGGGAEATHTMQRGLFDARLRLSRQANSKRRICLVCSDFPGVFWSLFENLWVPGI